MKYKALKALNPEELKKKYLEVQLELMKLNAQVATGANPKSPGQIRVLKKTIARIQTAQK
ncbi:MAG TPA: 50S ribosomal protein L29 [Candidatus Nanoarchaeia archaeon]|nr:50S ribosomal protein L29 [Candidatus Nanoarchaeia archaeon]